MKVLIEFDVLCMNCCWSPEDRCRNPDHRDYDQHVKPMASVDTCPLLERGGEEEDSED
jgi:hypothetical protein